MRQQVLTFTPKLWRKCVPIVAALRKRCGTPFRFDANEWRSKNLNPGAFRHVFRAFLAIFP